MSKIPINTIFTDTLQIVKLKNYIICMLCLLLITEKTIKFSELYYLTL